MTTPIGSISGTAVTGTVGSATGSTSADRSQNELDKDVFLKLLVAQMKYQDPSSPTDPSQFLAQTAQFTLVEKMEALADAQTELVASSHLQAATSMVGRVIDWSAGDLSGSGAVTSVAIAGGVPTLTVGGKQVPLSAVTAVRPGTTS
jgi:flagellar basal-body rod modification protein FlgD